MRHPLALYLLGALAWALGLYIAALAYAVLN